MKQTWLVALIAILVGTVAAMSTFLWLNQPNQNSENENPEEVSTELTEDAPFFITTMTHMEGGHNDDEQEAVFWRHVDQLRYAMDLADEYDAILTIESEKPFARANIIWDHNMMQEIMDRGHGVGTHCDLSPTTPKSLEEFTEDFKENKTLVDDLIGEENNHGCSGGGGMNDWVNAATNAGFTYLDGIVGFHLLAID